MASIFDAPSYTSIVFILPSLFLTGSYLSLYHVHPGVRPRDDDCERPTDYIIHDTLSTFSVVAGNESMRSTNAMM